MIKLLIVDDHPLILDGGEKLFSEVPDISVDTLEDIEAFVNVIENKRYDIFLIDVRLGTKSGIALAELVKIKYPSAIVLLYIDGNVQDYYSLIIEKKINNVIAKTATKEQILKTIYAAINNDILISKDFIDYVNNQLCGKVIKKILRFNSREKRILELIMEGYTNRAIALELNLKQRTIENNLSQIYALLNVRTRTEAVIKAKELDLI